MQTKEKKKSHIVRNTTGVLLLAVALSFFGHFGLGGGAGLGLFSAEPGEENQTDSKTVQAEQTPEDPEQRTDSAEEAAGPEGAALSGPRELVIRVSENHITVNGEAVADTAALKAYLENVHVDDTQYLLVDAYAIRGTYMEVQELLKSMQLDFAEQEEH